MTETGSPDPVSHFFKVCFAKCFVPFPKQDLFSMKTVQAYSLSQPHKVNCNLHQRLRPAHCCDTMHDLTLVTNHTRWKCTVSGLRCSSHVLWVLIGSFSARHDSPLRQNSEMHSDMNETAVSSEVSKQKLEVITDAVWPWVGSLLLWASVFSEFTKKALIRWHTPLSFNPQFCPTLWWKAIRLRLWLITTSIYWTLFIC